MADNKGGMPDIDFDKEMVGTIEVPEADQLDLEKLTQWFEANVEGYAGPISYTKPRPTRPLPSSNGCTTSNQRCANAERTGPTLYSE